MSQVAVSQPELFPPGELPEGGELLLPLERQRELYTLTTVARNQERLQKIIFLLGKSAPRAFIMKSEKIGWYTLQRISEAHGDKITDIKRRSAGKAGMFVELGLEQMLEDLQAGRIPSDKLAFTWKMVLDGMQLMTGDATSIIGTADSGPRVTAESLRERLANMKRADAVIELPTGSGVENLRPIAAGAPGAELTVPRSDSESVKQ